jgi:hypothetical protein
MQFFSTKKRIAIGAGVAVVALGAGTAAYAYFTTTGAGSGSATTGTTTNFTINQDAFGDGAPGGANAAVTLYPGAGVQKLGFTITNPGGGQQYVNTVGASIPADGSGDAYLAVNTAGVYSQGAVIAGCKASWFSLTKNDGTDWTATVSGIVVHQDIAAGATGGLDWTTSGLQMRMDDAALSQDACKSKNVYVAYTSN